MLSGGMSQAVGADSDLVPGDIVPLEPAMSSPLICDASPPPHWGSMNRH